MRVHLCVRVCACAPWGVCGNVPTCVHSGRPGSGGGTCTQRREEGCPPAVMPPDLQRLGSRLGHPIDPEGPQLRHPALPIAGVRPRAVPAYHCSALPSQTELSRRPQALGTQLGAQTALPSSWDIGTAPHCSLRAHDRHRSPFFPLGVFSEEQSFPQFSQRVELRQFPPAK